MTLEGARGISFVSGARGAVTSRHPSFTLNIEGLASAASPPFVQLAREREDSTWGNPRTTSENGSP